MDVYEAWLAVVALGLIVLWIIAEVATRKHEEDTTAYWKRKIKQNGERQRWGGK